MFSFNTSTTKEKVYNIWLNEKRIKEIDVKRISGLSNVYKALIKRNHLPSNTGYFIYKQEGFQTFLFNFNVDLVFVDANKNVIEILKNVKPNVITKRVKGTKFLYVFNNEFTKFNNVLIGTVFEHKRK